MFGEDWCYDGHVGFAHVPYRGVQVGEEGIQAGGLHGDEHAAWSRADILKGVRRAAGRVDGSAGAGAHLNTVHFKQVLAFEHVEPFILPRMAVERWSGL